jgi:hypothetical protein
VRNWPRDRGEGPRGDGEPGRRADVFRAGHTIDEPGSEVNFDEIDSTLEGRTG